MSRNIRTTKSRNKRVAIFPCNKVYNQKKILKILEDTKSPPTLKYWIFGVGVAGTGWKPTGETFPLYDFLRFDDYEDWEPGLRIKLVGMKNRL